MPDAKLPVDQPTADHKEADFPPPAPTATTGNDNRARWRHILTVAGGVLGLFIAYEIVTSIVAYTDDAHVRSDLVAVAPEVTAPVVAVHVVDNQDVKVGDKLVSLDLEPFQLEVREVEARLTQAKALVIAAQDELHAAQAALASATSAFTYAAEMQKRLQMLARSQNAPLSELDKANDDLRRATAEITVSQSMIAKAQSTIAAQEGAVAEATAALATAKWRLSRTEIVAPVTGSIVNLTVRVGDMGNAGVPLIGIVDGNAWRIVAHYKQDYIRSFEIGGTAWVWLDSQPWHFHRARITGIARGISRNEWPDKLLPYVPPTTDWIRLQRRIPVTMVLVDLPADFKLFMGADARTVIFP